MLTPFRDSPNLDLRGKMHILNLVTGSFVARAPPLCRDLSLTVLHPDARGSGLVELRLTVAPRRPRITSLCLRRNCFFPQDAVPLQSVQQTHVPGFDLRDASSAKPFQTVSLPTPHHPWRTDLSFP